MDLGSTLSTDKDDFKNKLSIENEDTSEDEGIFLSRKTNSPQFENDSNSQSENDKTKVNKDEDEYEDDLNFTSRRKNKNTILSDDEDEEVFNSKKMDSENDDDEIFNSKKNDGENESDEDLLKPKPKNRINPLSLDSDGSDTEDENVPNMKYNNLIKETCHNSPVNIDSSDDENEKNNSQNKKKSISHKENEKNLQEIRSESQRMVRDSDVSLPYHRPKQRTLQEFLQRKKVVQTSCNETLKMSMKNKNVLRALEDSKKEIEDFYKSASEDEGDADDKDWTPQEENQNNSEDENPLDEELPDLSSIKSGIEELKNSAKSSSPIHENNLNDHLKNPTMIIGEETGNLDDDPKNEDVMLDDKPACPSEEREPSSLLDDEMTKKSKNILEEDASTSVFMNDNNFEKGDDSITSVLEATVYPSVVNEKINKLGFLKCKLLNSKLFSALPTTPRLKLKKTSDIIDFDEDVRTSTPIPKPGYSDLMNRFLQHSSTKKKLPSKEDVVLNVIIKQKGEDGKENLVNSPITISGSEDKVPIDETRGVGLSKLKLALKEQIVQQREAERQRRFKEKRFMETEEVQEDYVDTFGLPDEEMEFDLTDTDGETESEPEEDDIVISDKKRKTNEYLDEEADDDDAGHNNDVEFDTEDDTKDTVELNSKPKLIISDNEDESNKAEDDFRLFMEDSNGADEDENNLTVTQDMFCTLANVSDGTKENKDANNQQVSTLIDSSFELIGSILPAYQPEGGMKNYSKTKSNTTLVKKNKSFCFSTEDSFTSESAFDDLDNQEPNMNEKSLILSPLDDAQQLSKKSHLKSKICLDLSNIGSTQDNASELLGLCSGKFSVTENEPQSMTQDMNELMGLCSGKFNDGSSKVKKISKLLHLNESDNAVDEDLLDLCTGQFDKVAKDDKIIRLLDVEENVADGPDDELLGLCTGKFTTKESSEEEEEVTLKERTKSNFEMVTCDEGVLATRMKLEKKKKRRRIMVESDDENNVSGEESDDEDESSFQFDDEENEVAVKFTGFMDKQKGRIRADFLENEAELSGSEEGSDDEEEPNEENDIMEEELGDQEVYDEEQLRDEVGRAHLRTELDEDKRRVRLLQEMYLEDGDLHGEGRQRKFRWKNVDADENDVNTPNDEENDDQPEEDNEDAEWRKERYEREKFLQESQKEENEEINLSNLIKQPLKRKESVNTSIIKEPLQVKNQNSTLNVNTTFDLFNNKTVKKGSFLKRDSSTLARFSEVYKEKTTGNIMGSANQKGNFVFQQLTAEEKRSQSIKRSASSSNQACKKTKLDRSFLSLDESSRSTSIFQHLNF